MEDAARFVLDAGDLSSACKQLRHDLRDALPPEEVLLPHRNTPGDVGTDQHTAAEFRREHLHDLTAAAGKRLSEALRTLEEFTKLWAAQQTQETIGSRPSINSLPGALKQLRYRGYELEQRLRMRLAARQRGRQWRLCVLLTRSLCNRPWEDVLQQTLDAGADCVQVREKESDDAELLAHAQDVVQRVRAFAAAHPDQPAPSVIVNDRPDLAVLAGADGVHLGQHDLSPPDARRLLGPDRMLGVSTSSLEQARAAADAGADYCGVGPMFATTTTHKPDLAGPGYLRAFLEHIELPHLAIGGVSPENLPTLVEAGVRGVAVCAAIGGADDPGQATRQILSLLPAAAATG